jgi:hypothetical protein
MGAFGPGGAHLGYVVMGCVDAPQKHEPVLDPVRPVADELDGEDTHHRRHEQAGDRLRLEAIREAGHLTERSERRNGPRKLDSALSEIFLGFQAAKLAWTGS